MPSDQAINDIRKAFRGQALTPKEIHQRVRLCKSTVYQCLDVLERSGEIVRVCGGYAPREAMRGNLSTGGTKFLQRTD